jgi:hypothetical protein
MINTVGAFYKETAFKERWFFDFVNAMQQVLHCPEIIENLLKVVDQ